MYHTGVVSSHGARIFNLFEASTGGWPKQHSLQRASAARRTCVCVFETKKVWIKSLAECAQTQCMRCAAPACHARRPPVAPPTPVAPRACPTAAGQRGSFLLLRRVYRDGDVLSLDMPAAGLMSAISHSQNHCSLEKISSVLDGGG